MNSNSCYFVDYEELEQVFRDILDCFLIKISRRNTNTISIDDKHELINVLIELNEKFR